MQVAYGVTGSGKALIFLPGVFYHVQLAWQYPGLKEWMEGLAKRFRLIQIDPRGTGMSSRNVTDDHVREDYQCDLEAVIDRLKLDRFILFAASRGVDIAVDYCLAHAGKVEALLLGTSGRGGAPAVFETVPHQNWEVFLHLIVPRDRSHEAQRMVELSREASDARNFALRWRALGNDHGRGLSELSLPTLVMHAREYALTPVEEGMKVAQRCGAQLVVLDGSDPWGDSEQGLAAIEAFLADVLPEVDVEPTNADGLSPRELEVLALIAVAKSNPQIALELALSINTVQRHVSNILAKTGLANRTEAAVYARDRGIRN